MSNLSEFLNENGITAQDLAAQSKAMEAWNNRDRDLMVQREKARKAKKPYEEAKLSKPERYGRGISVRTVEQAVSGKPMTRLTRKKITRAVNCILTTKKKDAVEWRVLFADVGSRKGKSK